jgi:hypothetical protein
MTRESTAPSIGERREKKIAAIGLFFAEIRAKVCCANGARA